MKQLAVTISILVITASATFAEVPGSLRDIPESVFAEPASSETPGMWQSSLDVSEPISTSKAILYSLLVPGWGEYAAGNRGRATLFFAAEAAIWTSFVVFRYQGGVREDSYERLAVDFAGVSGTGLDDDFYKTIKEYDSWEEYRADLLNDARLPCAIDPSIPCPTPSELDTYFEQNAVSDFQEWEWSSVDRRVQFFQLRSASKDAYRRSLYSVAAAGVNRLVSAISVFQMMRSQNQQATAPTGRLHFSAPYRPNDPFLGRVMYVRSF